VAGGLSPRSRGAKALLYTILGEFVLPAGGSAWTASLISGLAALDVAEKNARQAIARVAEQGVVSSERFGRSVRWHLTASGRHILETGAERIYDFGEPYEWKGEWLVVHCPVPETKRPLRHQVRKRLAFEGFGELAPSLAVSPHVDRESAAREILADLDLAADSILLRARTGSMAADRDLVTRAWTLDTLASSYTEFAEGVRRSHPSTDEERFRATVELVHRWRGFPFVDPELPLALLPADWAGFAAAACFRERRAAWSAGAQRWYAAREREQAPGPRGGSSIDNKWMNQQRLVD
jgi:phenylacetic acid degradation operon negative regulatory protein